MSPTAVPTAPAPSRAGPARTLFTAPFRAVTWRSFAYLVVRIPLAALAFLLVPALVVAGGLSLTVVGVPLLALVIVAARGAGSSFRGLSRGLLGTRIADPAAFVPRPGVLGRLGSALGDPVGWRAIGYVLVAFPLYLVGGYAVAIWIGTAFGGVTYPVWWSIRGVTSDGGGRVYQGLQVGRWHADSWPEALLVCAVGLLAFWAAPWLVRGVVSLDVLLQRWLLAGTSGDRRVAALEAARAEVVEDAAATLRRVERDLHDGTQAQLVAVAMTLDRARSRLAAGDTPAATLLLDGAHGAAKEALTDLREVVRRIHPPVLDQGLAPALHTLTSRCALPVRLEVDVPVRAVPGVETIVYFCVAELLTNAVRHSGARGVDVTVRGGARGDLAVRVRDDGRGGAVIGAPDNGAPGYDVGSNGAGSNGAGSNGARSNGAPGTGLAGLAARVRAVDGRFEIDSPAGGPTVVRVDVPGGA